MAIEPLFQWRIHPDNRIAESLMTEHRRSDILSRSKADRQPSASSKRSNGRISLSEVLFVKNGLMELKIPRGVLPDFLVEANAEVNRGHVAEAIALMSDDNVRQACRKADIAS